MASEHFVYPAWADFADSRYQLAWAAVLANDNDGLGQALDSGISVNAVYEVDTTTGDFRAYKDHRFGITLLHKAVMKGFVEVVQVLLRRGADIEENDFRRCKTAGQVPLITACKAGDSEIVKCLVWSGAQLETDTAYQGCLDAAYRPTAERRELVEFLLDSGADVNHRPSHGATVLDLAIRAEDAPFILYLIARNASLDSALVTATEYIVGEPILKLLLSFGAPDADSQALANVCADGRGSIVQLLLDHHGVPSGLGLSCVMWSTMECNRLSILDLLLRHGASAPLDSVIELADVPNDRTAMVRRLIASGIDVRVRVESIPDVLYDDSEQEHVGERTLEDGFGYYMWRVVGSTALHAAATNAYPGVVRALLDAGAEADAVNSKGITPLMMMCWCAGFGCEEPLGGKEEKRIECIKMLLSAGADAGRRDKTGRTTMEIVEANEEIKEKMKVELAKILRGD